MDADEQKRFNWIKNVYGDWEEHAFMIKQVELARAEVERLKAENYNDLLDQMDAKGWGNFHEINTEEVYAFINSRATHKPTTKLRTANKQLREALETIRANPFGESWASEYAEEALKEGE